jgi:hypothetical protein
MLEILIGIFLGFVIFYAVLRWITSREINRLINELEQKSINSKSLYGVIEKHNDMLYMFSRDTDEFIAQGHDMDDLKKRIHERYRGSVTVYLVDSEISS